MDIYAPLHGVFYEEGDASHIGRFHSVAKYVTDETTGFYVFGIIFAANGDQIFWEHPGGNVIYITGGTDRFQGATDEIIATVPSSNFVAGPSGTKSRVSTYTAVWTISY